MTTWTEALPLLDALSALDPLEGFPDLPRASPGWEAWSAWILACECNPFEEQCDQCSRRRRVRDLVTARWNLVRQAERTLRLTERAGAGKEGQG